MGDRICGETFESNAKLHHHVAEAHIKHMQNDPHNGFVCGWHECIRPGNPQKLGFEGKSKLKRHIITHVGPGTFNLCRLIVLFHHVLLGWSQAGPLHRYLRRILTDII